MKIGYCRVSTQDQNLDLQRRALKAAGVERVFADKISGTVKEREGLAELLAFARSGDCVVVWRLDRLGRSLRDLIAIAGEMERRGVQLVSLTESIDTTSPAGKLFFHIFGALAEFERNLIAERTKAGLDAARSRGRSGGRKPVLSPEKKKTLDLLLKDSKDYGAHARSLGVSERTVRRYATGQYT
jgi:DNA invertase Pin-like site-specific DNA recombinase